MPNKWVKYVNKLRIVISKTIVNLYTDSIRFNTKNQKNHVKVIKNIYLSHFLYSNISTTKSHYYYLLNKSFTHNPQHLLLRLKMKIKER
jgi:hypothetical protein